jgi:hypothetical protein
LTLHIDPLTPAVQIFSVEIFFVAMARKLRSGSDCWLIGMSITTINTQGLPSNHDVLLKYMHHHVELNQNICDSCKATIDEVFAIRLLEQGPYTNNDDRKSNCKANEIDKEVQRFEKE